jgi:hypothetical protein
VTHWALVLLLASFSRAQVSPSTPTVSASTPTVHEQIKADWAALKGKQKEEREAFKKQAEEGRLSMEQSLAGKPDAERNEARKIYRTDFADRRRALHDQQKREREEFLRKAEDRRKAAKSEGSAR